MRKTALALTLALALAVSFSANALFGVSVANFHVPPTPVIELESPTSFVNLPDVPLVVRAKVTTIVSGAGWEGIRWLNYSVDGKSAMPLTLELQSEIHTLVNDTTNPFNGDPYNLYVARAVLSGLSDGQHYVSVDGQSIFNKTLHLAELFTVDTLHPKIKVLSPLPDNTYLSTNLTLEYQVDESISWAGYKLDGGDLVTSRINTMLTNLSYRTHVIQVYANDSAGNQCYSRTIVFTIKDVDPPTITVFSAGTTYNATDVPLNFAVNEGVS